MNLRSLLAFGDRAPEASAAPTFFPLQREVERMFDDFRFGMPSVFDGGPVPRMDVVEKDGHIEVTAELPGMERDDVKIELADDMLLISGEKRREQEETTGGRKVTERSYGRFSRALELPPGTKAEDIVARMDKGVLTLELPKPALRQPETKRIEIKAP
jgi:HSP20 family protein